METEHEKKPNKNNLCIPRMENKIHKKEIFTIFKKLNIGYIEKIIEIPLKNENDYKRIIVRIKWNKDEQTEKIQSRLQNGEAIYIVYELPWFWKVVLCNK
jgi:signal recognition particle subunit SEC65